MGWGAAIVPGSEFGPHSSSASLQLTYVDFLAYDLLDLQRRFEPKCLDAFPNLKDFVARFEVIALTLLLVRSRLSSLLSRTLCWCWV